MDNSTAIIDPKFCSNESIQIKITRRVPGLWLRHLKMTDNNSGNIIFRTKNLAFINFRNRTTLVDDSGTPLVSFKKKIWSKNGEWKVFKGKSFEENDLILTVEKTKKFQLKIELNVYLASNTTREVCDYRIEGNYFKRTVEIFKGDSSDIVAQMVEEKKLVSRIFKRRSYLISIDPNVDSALIAVLFAIRHEFYLSRKKKIVSFGLTGVLSAIMKAPMICFI
ncbi:hypothetical protein LUZ60_003892 [Juncus effusus]|nr:hypothetical protein LUZ60_003892 [Juncus effusus]